MLLAIHACLDLSSQNPSGHGAPNPSVPASGGHFNLHSSHLDFGNQNRSVHRAGDLLASMELSEEAGKEGPQTLGLFKPWQPKSKQILLTCVEVSPEEAERERKILSSEVATRQELKNPSLPAAPQAPRGIPLA